MRFKLFAGTAEKVERDANEWAALPDEDGMNRNLISSTTSVCVGEDGRPLVCLTIAYMRVAAPSKVVTPKLRVNGA